MRLCVYPLGVRSTRFAGPACAELPGRDPTLEHRAPRRKEACLRSKSASRSPLGERSARAFGIAIPWHDPATCDAAAMPRNRDAMSIRMSASKRSAGRHLAFSDPRTVAFAPAGRRVGPFRIGTEGHAPSTTSSSRRREGPSGRFCLLESPASTTFASRLNPRRVHYDLGQVR